jgi:hypothetical protein
MFPSTAETGGGSQMNHDGFAIETFEAGRGLWHARIRRTDREPVVIDGVLFPAIEVGFAWSDRDAAIEDARNQIDRLKLWRYATSAQMPPAERSAA